MSVCSDGLSSDQYFLVNFIMTNYLGPDLYSDNPRCSASQRLAKGLPPYTLKHIGSSSLTVVQLQNLYHYVLRNAQTGLVLHPDMIYMYLKGYLPLDPIEKFPQFTYFFPTNLHPRKRYSPSHEIVKGIVVIDDPQVACISKEELQRFKCLSRLNDLKIDRVMSLSPQCVQLDESRRTEQDCSRNGEVKSNGLASEQDLSSSAEVRESCKRKKEAVAGYAVYGISKTTERFRETYKRKRFKNSSAKAKQNNSESAVEKDKTGQHMSLKLVPFPPDTKEKREPEPAVVITGTASKGASVGVVDIGVNKVAYFFQVALPGVCKDYGEFSCEIESDGKVILEGSTTQGWKTVERHSRVFEMNIRKLCPSGPFKLCFSLPGPVDPRLFSPNFRSDGIFEGVILGHKNSN